MSIPDHLRWQPTGTKLGQGGQAPVYEVVDRTGEFSGSFALKGLAADRPPQAYERFEREVTAIKRLNHPSVIRIHDHSMPGDGFQYYVMDYFPDAKPLAKILEGEKEENPFYGDALAALKLFERLADVIDSCDAHDVKVVHRDLSPANILVLPDQTIRVIDFGICQIDGATPMTRLDEGLGTRNYAPHECETGGSHNITPKSDLYSAGKIMWSAITGQWAFAREDAVFRQKSMRNIFNHIPATWHLHHIFENTVRHDPENRWGSATALWKSRRLAQIIREGYPPLEMLVDDACPLCGVGALQQRQVGFGNLAPNCESLQCSDCFTAFVVDRLKRRKKLADRERLD